MGALPRRWIKSIAVILGVAGMLTPALIELGWIPENQGQKAVIFLLGFIVLQGAARESDESAQAPELFTTTEGYLHAVGGFLAETKHELLGVVRGNDIMTEEVGRYVGKILSTLRSEKQLHNYTVVVSRIGELSEESFSPTVSHRT
jgi:hypothetical protein